MAKLELCMYPPRVLSVKVYIKNDCSMSLWFDHLTTMSIVEWSNGYF